MRESTPKFVQGAFAFTGAGYEAPTPLTSSTVSDGRRAQMIYLRAGNSSPEMVVVSVSKDGAPMRLFPIGAKGAIHVPLAVVEDIDPGTTLDLAIAAPAGITGTVVIDFGLVEI
jgi:hypothetical protein